MPGLTAIDGTAHITALVTPTSSTRLPLRRHPAHSYTPAVRDPIMAGPHLLIAGRPPSLTPSTGDHRQRTVSGSDATSKHWPVHTDTSPQLSGTQRHFLARGRTANPRSHRSARSRPPAGLVYWIDTGLTRLKVMVGVSVYWRSGAVSGFFENLFYCPSDCGDVVCLVGAY